MPLDAPIASADLVAAEPKFVEPLLPGADGDDWQTCLRQIFATEDGMWQRRARPRPRLFSVR